MPPRKPNSGRTPRGDDPVIAEKKRLLAQQEELMRQQERARRLIEEAPRRLEQLKKKQREPIRISLNPGRAGKTTFSGPGAGGKAATPARPRPRKSERNLARLQFLVSVVILAVIVFLILRAIPTT